MIKRKIKRIAAGVAAFMLAFSMTACGGKKDDKKTGDGKDTAGSVTESTTEDGSDDIDLSKINSKEFAVLMGNGINLGNTMEAADSTRPGDYPHHEISYYETRWSQPITEQRMIDDMKASGLDTLRIPVAWANTMDFVNGDYTINEAQLARVKEIVDMA